MVEAPDIYNEQHPENKKLLNSTVGWFAFNYNWERTNAVCTQERSKQ